MSVLYVRPVFRMVAIFCLARDGQSGHPGMMAYTLDLRRPTISHSVDSNNHHLLIRLLAHEPEDSHHL